MWDSDRGHLMGSMLEFSEETEPIGYERERDRDKDKLF